MCEVQKFELLKKLRQKALKGKKIIEKALNETTSKNIIVEGAILDRSVAEKFKQLLEKATITTDVNEMKKLFEDEEIIPLELIIVSQFWNKMQELVYSVTKLEDRQEIEMDR